MNLESYTKTFIQNPKEMSDKNQEQINKLKMLKMKIRSKLLCLKGSFHQLHSRSNPISIPVPQGNDAKRNCPRCRSGVHDYMIHGNFKVIYHCINFFRSLQLDLLWFSIRTCILIYILYINIYNKLYIFIYFAHMKFCSIFANHSANQTHVL